jgi:hypothetical protein
MVESEILPNHVLVLRPSAPIEAADISAVRAKVDALINSGGRLSGVMIEASGFPGWKDLAGLTEHLRFVREHHKEVPRVAVVSDSRFLTALPGLARHFLHAEFEHFSSGRSAEALAWIEAGKRKPPSVIRRGWFPDRKLVWIYVHGTVHTDAYGELVDWMEQILAKHSPVSFLIDLEDLEGVDFGAVLKDLKFGMKHVRDISRMALVGNEKWTHRLASLPNPFSMEVRAFHGDEEYDAWDWATEATRES